MTEDVERYRTAEQVFLASEGVEVNEHFVDLAQLGGQVRVLETGEGPGPPVVFLPGVMTSGAVFAGLVGRLSGFRCLLIDRPGTGLSPMTSPPTADLAAQKHLANQLVADVLDGLNIDLADQVCTSIGGFTAFRGAAAHPDRIGRIAALAFQLGARITDAPLTMRLPTPAFMVPNRVRATPAMVQAMLRMGGMRSAIDNNQVSDEMLAWMVSLLRDTDTFGNDAKYGPRPAGISGPIEAVRHPAELLAKVTSPVRLFWGTDDLFGDESSAHEFAEALPNAELQLVPGAGHAPWLDEPDLAAEAVTNHLTRE